MTRDDKLTIVTKSISVLVLIMEDADPVIFFQTESQGLELAVAAATRGVGDSRFGDTTLRQSFLRRNRCRIDAGRWILNGTTLYKAEWTPQESGRTLTLMEAIETVD